MTDASAWTRWPHPAAVADPDTGGGDEPSPPVAYADVSLEGVLRGVAEDTVHWENELPDGIEKVSAARLGTADPLPSITTKNIWRHPNAHPLVLLTLLLNKYGPDYLEWEPEALRGTLKKDGVQMSESVWTKILAARVLMTSPSPWRQWEQFHWISYGLAGRAPNFVYLERPELGFIMSATDTMKMADRTRPMAEELTKYTAAVLRDNGIMLAPPPLQFAQEELNDRRLRCKKCGTREKDDRDIKCVACGSKDLERTDGPFEHLREPTEKLFKERRRLPLEQAVDGLPTTAAGNAAYKLLVHNEYRDQVRAQLVAQLRMLRKGG